MSISSTERSLFLTFEQLINNMSRASSKERGIVSVIMDVDMTSTVALDVCGDAG